MKIVVQGQNGKFYEVDTALPHCSCTGFRTQNRCYHLDLAHDIYTNSGKVHRWDVMSLFHKEIRRCDVERGVQAARVFARISKGGTSVVTNYCKTIIFEETRNVALLKAYARGDLSEKDQVRHMLRSRKKWELDYMKGHFDHWMKGFQNYYENRASWDQDKMIERIKKFDSLDELYEIVFYTRAHKEWDQWVFSTLAERAEREKNERLKDYLQYIPPTERLHYHKMVGLELAIGHFSEEANELHPDVDVTKNYIPNFPPYTFDCHGIRGLKKVVAAWPSIEKGHPNETVDMRWSGQLLGILWRFKAYEQLGSMTSDTGGDWPWEAVKIEPELWKQTIEFDSYFYGKLYSALREAGHKVPNWKEDHGP